MEPRPPRPSRPATPYVSTGSSPSPGPGHAPVPDGGLGAAGRPFDASSAPPAAAPTIGYDPTYSPGAPLSPLNTGRRARLIGPIVAVFILALVIAGIAWAVSRATGGDDNGDETAVAGTTSTDVAAPTEQPAAEGEDNGTQEPTPASEDAETPAETEGGDQPSEEAQPTPASTEPTPTPRPSRERDDARSWLPLQEEVGDAYSRTDNGRRSLEEVASSFPDPADAQTQLAGWGWLENVYREFQLSEDDPNGTQVINVSVHRFESAQGARDALPYYVDGATTSTVAGASGLPDIGSQVRGLEGTTAEGGSLFVLYVRVSDTIIRIAGTSQGGDPRPAVIALAERLLAE